MADQGQWDASVFPAGCVASVRLRTVAELDTEPPCCPGEVRSLAALADAARVFARCDTAPEIAEGVARVLVARRVSWCVLLAGGGDGDESVLTIACRPAAVPADLDHDTAVTIVPGRGIGRGLPAVEQTWGTENTLVLEGSGGTFELLSGSWGLLELATPRGRFGSLVVGTAPAGPPLEKADERLLISLAEKTALALEHAAMARAVERAAQARDAIVGVVVHDLATPLNSVELLLSRLAAMECDDAPPEFGRNVAAARHCLDQIRYLVSELVDVRDIEQGLFAPVLSTQPADQVLAAAVEQVEALARDRDVAVKLDDDLGSTWVRADPARVIQLLVNLLTNAIHASDRGSSVTVRALRSDERLTVEVEDRGSGIDGDRLAHLLDGFAGPLPVGAQRHGLGLMIAREIARAHGAPLEVDTDPGVGSVFSFSLPLADVPPE